MMVFLFFVSGVFAAEYVVHYCVEEQHMLACTRSDCSSWQHNCRHVKIFDNLDHALWFINGERPPQKLSQQEIDGGFVYVLMEPDFPFSSERKTMRNFKFKALYETKEIPLHKQVEVEEIVTKTKKETIKFAFYNNKTDD